MSFINFQSENIEEHNILEETLKSSNSDNKNRHGVYN